MPSLWSIRGVLCSSRHTPDYLNLTWVLSLGGYFFWRNWLKNYPSAWKPLYCITLYKYSMGLRYIRIIGQEESHFGSLHRRRLQRAAARNKHFLPCYTYLKSYGILSYVAALQFVVSLFAVLVSFSTSRSTSSSNTIYVGRLSRTLSSSLATPGRPCTARNE